MSASSVLTRLSMPTLAVMLVLPLAAAPGTNTKAPASKTATQVAPLLDRELFFGNPEIAGGRLSPDGKWIAFLKPWKDTRNVWVKKTGEPYSAAKLLTAEPKRPVPAFLWSRDSKRILFVKDKEGDENYNVWSVDPATTPEVGKEAPSARNLTDAKGARAMIYEVPKTSPDIIYVGLNDRDAAWHDLYKVNITTGERTLLRKNTERITGWVFDRKDNLRLAVRSTNKGDTEILRVDSDGLKVVYTCDVFESVRPLGFHKDGKRVYMITNKGDRDLIQLVLFDPETGKEELVEGDPLNRVDFGGAKFSEVTHELQATTYTDEKTRRYFQDKALEADYKLLQSKLPGMDISLTGFTDDERLLFVNAHSDTDPGTIYLFNRDTKKLALEYVAVDGIPREQMAAMKPIPYKSSDGLEIPAYLTLPKGLPAKNLPLIVTPHGGPWGRVGWGFDPLAQFLANRGYAVLSPNFRGSTGYGKKFLDAGNRQWGDKMQDDITWGVKHLVQEGIVDPRRVGIMGISYGGYATLAGVAFTPDLYAAAVSVVGPSNLLTLLETIPSYWEAIRIRFHERMGNPNTPEGKKQLERQSPLNSASNIKTPLMVVQGANDPGVNKVESEQIVVALRDRGFPVEYLCAPDEGHGFARPVNNMAMAAMAEKFLAKYLKARYQEGATPEVTKRLAEITVDPKTVVLTKKVEVGTTAPKPVAELKAGTFNYQGSVVAGPRTFPISITQVIKEEGQTWVVSATTKQPGGEMVDTTTIAKGTLIPVKRSMKQGPMAMEITFEGAKASGTMAMGGEPKPFSVDLGGQAFADGAGANDVLACLPLAEGYSATFRNFDPMKRKVSLKRVKVLGSEEAKVATGTFQTWKVEMASATGDPGVTTLWIAKDTRKVVKSVATLPQMAGAEVTLELQP
jgi:dipeptidyl aminopeptidase/acylaminoacyl peptidase